MIPLCLNLKLIPLKWKSLKSKTFNVIQIICININTKLCYYKRMDKRVMLRKAFKNKGTYSVNINDFLYVKIDLL